MKKSQLNIEKITKDILGRAGKPEPGPSFTDNVMNKINLQKITNVYEFKPLLGKRFFYLSASTLFFIIIFVLLATPKTSTSGGTILTEQVFPFITSFFTSVFGKSEFDFLNPVLIIGVIAIWFFWTVDHLIRRFAGK